MPLREISPELSAQEELASWGAVGSPRPAKVLGFRGGYGLAARPCISWSGWC